MKLSPLKLQDVMYDVAQLTFADNIFERQQLIRAVVNHLQQINQWNDDDLLSDHTDENASNYKTINWAISRMKISGALVSTVRNQWRIGMKPESKFCGIVQKLSFGARTGIYQEEYIENLKRWAESGRSWNTKIGYAALEGQGKKLLLYDPVIKGIRVEFEVLRVENSKQEPDFPWSNYIAPGSVKEYDETIPLDAIVLIPGLEGLRSRPSMVNLTAIQYQQLLSYGNIEQARQEGVYRHGLDLFRQRDAELMARRKAKDSYTCQVCGFFLRVGCFYIIDCHHLNPISQGERMSTLDDLISLCPTCHSIAHKDGKNPISLEQVKIIRQNAVYLATI